MSDRVPRRRSAVDGLGGTAALMVAVSGLLYSAAFIAAQAEVEPAELFTGVFLIAGGLLAVVVAVALFRRLHTVDDGVALIALILGSGGALGSAIHGAYDIAVYTNPPERASGLPNPVDPRGFLTFGVAALGVVLFSVLMAQSEEWPRRISALGYISGILLLVIYLGRLILLDPGNPLLLISAVIEGVLVNPAWYVGVGLHLRRADTQTGAMKP